ncbi:uncharacterized protein LOC132256010 [Phlebotomus argentipes]|uniref:uncharacterized protein LOC132256010 n=1 Tax=Phlebotomus argentipes TaxID=94469 RepID=UPI0028930ABD|nr:uncharacterized protein LOC132256010 [Phlebotomus argentipes]
MKCLFLGVVFAGILLRINGVVYLRSRSMKGPRTWRNGVECIKSIASFYFQEARVLRTKSITVVQLTNLSSPAREINVEFAKIANALVEEEFFTDSVIRVNSDKNVLEQDFNEDDFKPSIPSDYYVIVTDSNARVSRYIKKILRKTITWNSKGKFLILFNSARTLAMDENLTKFVEAFFRELYDKFDISNVMYAYSTGLMTYQFFRSKLFQRSDDGKCALVIAQALDTCSEGKIPTQQLLLQQSLETTAMTLNDCHLKLCCTVAPPFVDEGCATGVEITMMHIIQTRMQFDMEVVCTNMARGEVEDGTATDLLAELVDRKCDMLVGAFFPDNDLVDFGQSVPYLADSYTWYVPLAEPRAAWKGLIVIFLPTTWLLLIFSLICSGTVWFVLGRQSPREDQHHKLPILCLLNAWQVLLGISANNRPRFIPLRIIFLSLALYALNIGTIYTSKLITVFTTTVYDEQIDSPEDIIASGLPYGGRLEYMDWFENDEPLDKAILRNYNHSANFLPTIANLKRVKDGKQILLANRMFVLSNNYENMIYGFPNKVFSNPMEIITSKGFPLLLDINDIISTLKDAGVMFKLYGDFMNLLLNTGIERTVLSVRHLQGAFIVLMYGYGLSFAVFAAELARRRWFSH